MARLGDYLCEECRPVGVHSGKFRLVGVSNEHGLVSSPREAAADDLSRYQRVERDWFAYNPMRVNVGSIGLADDDSKTGITSPDYVVFSCRDGLDPRFLLHFLKSDYGLEAIARNCSGAVRKRLYYSGLAEIELTIPDPERQRKFITRIEHIQRVIRFICDENSDRHELPKLKQAILQAAIAGKLTAEWRAANQDVEPASQLLHRIAAEKARRIAAKKLRPEKPLPKITPAEIPFEIPAGWEWCRLANVMICRDGERSPISKAERGQRGKGYPYYGASGVIDEIDGFTHDGEFLLVGEDGSNLRLRSSPVAFEASGKIWVNNHAHVLEFIESVLREFVAHRINGMDIAPFVTGGFQPKLSQENLNHIPIPLPSLSEQAVIVERVAALMTICRTLEAEIEHGRTHAGHLLQAVLKEAFAPADQASSKVVRPEVEPTKYFIQLLPAILRAVDREVELDQLNAVVALLFLPDQLFPLAESIVGTEAREHLVTFAQPNEAGAFGRAIQLLKKSGALKYSEVEGTVLLQLDSTNIPPIAPEIEKDGKYLAGIIDLIPPENIKPILEKFEQETARVLSLAPA